MRERARRGEGTRWVEWMGVCFSVLAMHRITNPKSYRALDE